jgi:hypothetical protein
MFPKHIPYSGSWGFSKSLKHLENIWLNERERHAGIDLTSCEGYKILVPTCLNPKFLLKVMCFLGH